MAVVFAAIGAAIGSTTGAFLIMYAAELATAALILGSSAYSSAQRSRAKRQATAAYNAAQVDRLANVVTTTGKRQLVLGRCRVGGNAFFRGSTGQYNERFFMAVAIAGHEIDAVETVWFNDQALTLDANGWVQTAPYARTRTETRTIYSGLEEPAPAAPAEALPGTVQQIDGELRFSGRGADRRTSGQTTYQVNVTESFARVRWLLGSPDQAADAGLVAAFPSLWTADHRARGVAYLVAELLYDETAYATGIPTLTATVRGARCFDPRTGTTAWTENPAIMQRHVLLHPYFGKRSSLTAEEDARISAAANACDVAHNYGAGAVPLFRAALVAEYGTAARDLLDDLAQAMGGQWAHAAGQFHTRAGVYTAPVMTLTAADLATTTRSEDGSTSSQPVAISVHRARVDKVNSYTPVIWDSAQGFQRTTLAPVTSSALVAADGGSVLAQEIDLPAVFYAQQAQHVAGIAMRDARDPLVISASFTLRAWPLELFDVVGLTMPRYGWTAKPFMVLGRTIDGQGRVALTLKETAAAIYQPDAAFVASGYADNTALPNPWFVAPPTLGTPASGTAHLLLQADGTIVSRVWVTWAPIVDLSVLQAGGVQVQWALLAGDGNPLAWQALPQVPGNESGVYITGAPDGEVIAIRARARNTLAVGDWGAVTYHTVVGQTEPPPAFDFVAVLAQPDGTRQYEFGYTTTQQPADWLGCSIRYLPGTVAAPVWASMLPLQQASTHYTASPVEQNAPLEGAWTFAFRSLDRSGNLGPLQLVYATLAKRRSGSTYAEIPNDPAWPGTLASLVRVGSVLEAASATTWDTLPSTWDAWTTWAISPAASGSYTTPGLDLETTLAGQIDATVDALGVVTVELSTSADGSTWGAWQPASTVFVARWVRLRVTVAADGSNPLATLRALTWRVSAEVKREYLNDLAPGAFAGVYRLGTGDVRAPLANTYAVIRSATATVQDGSGGAWTWVRLDKDTTTGPRFQFRLAGALADPPLVDFEIEGI
jgi:hypothetical protein